jgi:bisphosphoglycerate-dependent phosphoglycerate mutase
MNAMLIKRIFSKKKSKKCSAKQICYYKLKNRISVTQNTVSSIYKSLDNRSVIIMRHGQSIWNEKNLFTGWEDADLTETGKLEARKAGQLLKQMKMRFDTAHCSLLRRAIKTLWITLEELDQEWIPVQKDWRLNERHYGHLTGLNKIEMEKKHGALTAKMPASSPSIRNPTFSPTLQFTEHFTLTSTISLSNSCSLESTWNSSLGGVLSKKIPGA